MSTVFYYVPAKQHANVVVPNSVHFRLIQPTCRAAALSHPSPCVIACLFLTLITTGSKLHVDKYREIRGPERVHQHLFQSMSINAKSPFIVPILKPSHLAICVYDNNFNFSALKPYLSVIEDQRTLPRIVIR